MKAFNRQARFLAAIMFVVVGTSLLTGCSLFSVTEVDEQRAERLKNMDSHGGGGGGS
jgi:hypothetical protein